MAGSSRYRVPLRRRRERKTDYQARKAFILSRKPRLVSRSSLKHTIAQIIIAKPHGDEILASAHSKELVKKYSWKAATGNLPTAYLTGLLCGLKAKANGVTEAILDLGLVSPTKGSKVFTVLSGVLDAGIVVPHSEEKIIPERAKGEHITEYAESLGSPEEYSPKFSTYFAKKLPPEKLDEHFEKVKSSVLASFGIETKAVVKSETKAKVKSETKVKTKPEVKAKTVVDKPKKPSTTKTKPAEGKAKESTKSGVKKTAKTGGKKE